MQHDIDPAAFVAVVQQRLADAQGESLRLAALAETLARKLKAAEDKIAELTKPQADTPS